MLRTAVDPHAGGSPVMAVTPAWRPGPDLTVVIPTYMERSNVELLVHRLRRTLGELRWQVIFVDDSSPDGTAEAVKAMAARDARLSCLRRVGRRGLAGAAMEGALASAAPYVAVMDGDGQHDETLLPVMLEALRAGGADVVVASRYLGRRRAEGLSERRLVASRLANRAARLCGVEITDPMSGFFMARREVFDAAAHAIDTRGFKILFDMLSRSRGALTVLEFPAEFRAREADRSKMDAQVVALYALLVCRRAVSAIWRVPQIAGAPGPGAGSFGGEARQPGIRRTYVTPW